MLPARAAHIAPALDGAPDMSWLSRLKLSSRIMAGFGLVLAILLASSIFAILTTYRIKDEIRNYRIVARANTAIGAMDADSARLRLLVNEFLRLEGERERKQVVEAFAAARR